MAVAREVKEESGIDVDPQTICYEASQPWPFPQSLMIGFQAQAAHSQNTAKREAELRQLKVACSPHMHPVLNVCGLDAVLSLAHARANIPRT